jgi:hypothetical protein
MVIVQHFPGSVNDYITAVMAGLLVCTLPERCPHPDCRAGHCLIRWGYYKRWIYTADTEYLLRVQRLRCKVCGRTHSLLPDFVHPHRRYTLDLQQQVVLWYVLTGLSWASLMDNLAETGEAHPALSTTREWVSAFVQGAGERLLDPLQRHLMALDPLAELPDSSAPRLDRVEELAKRRGLEHAHRFWLLAERLYAQIKARLPRLHFSAQQLFPFLLHWLQSQHLPPRLFWSIQPS